MRAGFYECDVTPPLGGFLWGHYQEKFAEDVFERLHVKSVVVESDGNVAAFLIMDTCAMPEGAHDVITKRIYDFTGITADKVSISSNHTHWGAPVHNSPEIGCYRDEPYTDVFFRLCADAVILAYKRLDEVEIEYVLADSGDGVAFCRNFLLKDGTYKTHGRGRDDIVKALGEPDTELPILMFKKNGKPIGAITNYSMHQCTGYTTPYGYHGDYSSVMSRKLKEVYGPDFVNVFLLGTCGDVTHVDPNPDNPLDNFRGIGEKLAKVFTSYIDKAEPMTVNAVKSVKEYIKMPRRTMDPEAAKKRISELSGLGDFMRARNLMYYMSKKQPEFTNLPVQCIVIGDILFVSLPGEVYNLYGRKIKELSPFKRTVVVENANEYCGYIPNKDLFGENDDLYETSLCYHSCHIPEAGEILTDKALEIANKLK